MSSNPQPSEILRAAAKRAPVVLPVPLGDAAAAWLLAEANCHESVHEVGSTFVGMVDSIAGKHGAPTRYSVAISTVNTAVEFARAILATPEASSAERSEESLVSAVAEALRDFRFEVGPITLEMVRVGQAVYLTPEERHQIAHAAVSAYRQVMADE